MITEEDLRAAIAECEGQRNPTSSTCMKLAAFYTIQDRMFPAEQPVQQRNEAVPGYSYAPAREQRTYDSDTEFMQIARGMNTNDLLAVIDEIMTALSVYNPKLYAAAIRKLEN